MCWGFECGDGWFGIIDDLCEKIQNHVDKTGIHQVEAVQVKEKWGGLRFYINCGDDYIHNLINNAENESFKTCEICGSKKDVSCTGGSWVSTRCTDCHL